MSMHESAWNRQDMGPMVDGIQPRPEGGAPNPNEANP